MPRLYGFFLESRPGSAETPDWRPCTRLIISFSSESVSRRFGFLPANEIVVLFRDRQCTTTRRARLGTGYESDAQGMPQRSIRV
jgi:hypothetical protein